MFDIKKEKDIEKNYQQMVYVIKDILKDEDDIIANFANISAVINTYMERLNWVGFYILKGDELVLGPFQGSPACVRIKAGKGVCGKAAKDGKIILVDNVHEFSGHIACDSKTNSEIVIPIFKNGKIYGVLDLDSPYLNRFTEIESKYLSEVGEMVSLFLDR